MSSHIFRRSQRGLSIDVAERSSMLKNYQNTHYPRFSSVPKTGVAFPKTGISFLLWGIWNYKLGLVEYFLWSIWSRIVIRTRSDSKRVTLVTVGWTVLPLGCRAGAALSGVEKGEGIEHPPPPPPSHATCHPPAKEDTKHEIISPSPHFLAKKRPATLLASHPKVGPRC